MFDVSRREVLVSGALATAVSIAAPSRVFGKVLDQAEALLA